MNTFLITPPTEEPVTLQEAKDYCRVTHDYEDAVITGMIRAARLQCENASRRSFINQTRRLELAMPKWNTARFDVDRVIHDPDDMVRGVRLPMRFVSSLDTISGVYSDGSLKSISNELVVFDEVASSVRWTVEMWNELSGCQFIRIDYTAGQGVEEFGSSFPDLVDAVKMLVDFKYTHRSGNSEMPKDIRNILQSHWTSVTYSLP